LLEAGYCPQLRIKIFAMGPPVFCPSSVRLLYYALARQAILYRLVQVLEFDELIGYAIDRVFLRPARSDSPLLHRQRAKEDFDWLAVFILADFVYYKRVSSDLIDLNFSFENRDMLVFLDFTTERSTERTCI